MKTKTLSNFLILYIEVKKNHNNLQKFSNAKIEQKKGLRFIHFQILKINLTFE